MKWKGSSIVQTNMEVDYSAIYGTASQQRFQFSLIVVFTLVSALWFIYINKYKKIYFEPDKNPYVHFSFKPPSLKTSSKPLDRLNQQSISELNQPTHIPEVKAPSTSDKKPTLGQKTEAAPNRVNRSAKVSELMFNDNADNTSTDVFKKKQSSSRYYSDRVFDTRIEDKVSQAKALRPKTSAVSAQGIETYTDVNGNDVRRVGNLCAKNNSAMAEAMGVDTMFFTTACTQKKYKIEFNYQSE